jgi:general stress protein 26
MDAQGRLWFFTALSSGKVAEIDQHRKVNLSYSNFDKQDYVSVSGSARLLRDREKMRALWTRWVEPWFPNGLDDPDLALLEVTIDEAEFWDAPASRMQRLFGLTKALTTGDTSQLGEHEKVHPQH